MITLAAFEGTWRVARQIADAYGGQDGVFAGEAVFAPDADGMRYDEAGTLTIGAAAPMRAERRYYWRDAAGVIVVTFADGRAFHDFDPNGAVRADHLCGDDLYKVHYDFGDWPQWSARWAVRGPRKDYVMTSHYTRR